MFPGSPTQERLLLALAVVGLVGPNGVFLYHAAFHADVLRAALANPIALVFIVEALALMGLFAWLIHRSGQQAPGWKTFIVMSLLGSLLFSVPGFLYLVSRRSERATRGEGGGAAW